VFQTRVYPVRGAELPCLLVYTDGEQADEATLDEIDERRIAVRIEALARAAADLDDTLDQIAKEVEVALETPVFIASTTTQLTYTGCEIEFRDDLQVPHGSAVLAFEALIFTSAPDAIVGA
jgi:hypothetical protein